MIKCMNCGVSCVSEEEVFKKEGVLIGPWWCCDACYEVVSENLARLEFENNNNNGGL